MKFLIANGESPDGVVTNIAYNLDAETMQIQFTPVRGVSDEEYAMVKEARNDPATRQMIVLTVAAQANATAPKEEAQPKITYSDEPDEDEEEEIEAPKKRPSKAAEEIAIPQKNLANVVAAWGDGADEDED